MGRHWLRPISGQRFVVPHGLFVCFFIVFWKKKYGLGKKRRRREKSKAAREGNKKEDDGDTLNFFPTPIEAMTAIDDLPDELLVHILRMGFDGDGDDDEDPDQRDVFLAAVRLAARRWRDVATVFWRPVAPHAYGRCLQFLKDTGDDAWLAKPRTRRLTKRRIVAKAVADIPYAQAEAGPALDSVVLRPYDYATALVEAFGTNAPKVAHRECLGERCPACDQRPDQCVCLCGDECWPCKGRQPLSQCRMVLGDVWDGDYPGDWDGDSDNGGRLASEYPRLDKAIERHRAGSMSCRSRMRHPTLAHWSATRTSPTDAAVYIARCAQTLVSHALADAVVIGRMSCSAVIRRAHRLNDYRVCARDPLWDIGGCDCGQWTFGEKRCVCDNVKYYYGADDVEIDGAYSLDLTARHGSLRRG